ncbi:MAG: hypothetical protein ACJA1A_000342 [Saprospiraceae bacterium]|jgi:hypothetical protein|tara:strand:- start:2832 stop:3002 length:171 start_codon:yes stop_codon:yes gene_type:complete
MNVGLLYSRLLASKVTGGISYTGAAAINFTDKKFEDVENILTKNQIGFSLRLAYKL